MIKAPVQPSTVGTTALQHCPEEQQNQPLCHHPKDTVSPDKPVVLVSEPVEIGNSVMHNDQHTHISASVEALEQLPPRNSISKQQQEALKEGGDVSPTCQQGHALAPPPPSSPTGPGQEVTWPGEADAWNKDEDLIVDIANELDKWDKLHSEDGQVPSAISEHDNAREQQRYGKLRVTDCPNAANSDTTHPMLFTPSRAQCIAHVAPVTLLTSSGQHAPLISGFTNEIMHRSTTSPVQPQPEYSAKQPPSCHQQTKSVACSRVLHAPSNNPFSSPFELKTPPVSVVPTPVVHTQAITSPLCHSSVSTHSTPDLDSHQGSLGNPSPTNSPGSFRTPSTVQWMKLKKTSQQFHTPHTSPRDPLVAFNGGKVTPPLCNCGRRTRRKVVTSSGPNEGKPFFACPLGRGTGSGKGCGFFRWEQSVVSPSNSSSSSLHSTGYCSPEIFSDYSD